MDTALLRTWLGLPAGPWPPPDRELLGLPAGPLDPAAVEAAALDRMARLRTHQLVHPDLVTEGMNRVARAMLAVGTAAPARRPVSPPPVLDAVPVADDPPVAKVAPVPALTRPAADPIPIPADAAPPAGLDVHAGVAARARRQAYRELAGLRAVLRALDRLRPSVALPGEALLGPAAVCDLLEAVDAVRSAGRHPGLPRRFTRGTLPKLSAVVRSRRPLAVIRSLSRPQRLDLAREWAEGRAGVVARRAAVRDGLAAGRPVRRPAVGPALLGRLLGRPERLLGATTGLIGLVAVARALAG
jgi:hypothetical protein